MNEIQTLPEPSDFGLNFSYAVWTPDTTVRLCNVPWNNDYRDVVEYDSQADLDAYIDSAPGPSVVIKKMMYLRVGEPIRINLPFNRVMNYNYIRVNNPVQPIHAHYTNYADEPVQAIDTLKTYYYFITNVEYVAPNTTQITVQLDVWSTFWYQANVGTAFVERGHMGIANTAGFTNYGRDFLTVPEGFDIGNEYQITENYSHEICDTHSSSTGPWFMIGTSTAFDRDFGTVDDPKLNMAAGSYIEGIPQAIDIWFVKDQLMFDKLMFIFREAPWVTQGIQFIQIIPPLDDVDSGDFVSTTIDGDLGVSATIYKSIGTNMPSQNVTLKSDWRDTAINNLPTRYRHLKKFLTFPYCVLELTTYNGQPLMLKPELMNSSDIIATIYRHITPPTTRWSIMPQFYNVPSGKTQADGEYFDVATHVTNFPKVSVLNDQYINYMASYRNRIAYDYSSADWSQQRALAGNDAAFNNASVGIGMANSMADANVMAMQQSAALANNMSQAHAVANTAGDILNVSPGKASVDGRYGAAAAAGIVKSGVTNGANAAMDVYQTNQQLGINRTLARANQGIQSRGNSAVRDTNKAYADFAANGDYANTIAGINARVQDAKMLQPSVSGQMDGESFMMSTGGGLKVYAKVKQPNLAAITSIGDYWLRYGYSINRFFRFTGGDSYGLKVMSKFTYWKMKEVVFEQTYIPENFKQTLRGILEKGVTIWSDANYIGVTAIDDNDPLTGITYGS